MNAHSPQLTVSAPPSDQRMQELSADELFRLSAADGVFYSHAFFPRTCRQATPEYHYDMWRRVENPLSRLVNLQVFRGGAKTTTCRIASSKRIVFAKTNTMLYVGKSEGHAMRSVRWLKRIVEYNDLWRTVFRVRKGDKWQDIEIEIIVGDDVTVPMHKVWIMGMGVTGSIRGINQDDFRPDFIVLDDVMSEETASTAEQRQKINDLVYGALKQSLAPASENPNAKLISLQTPLNREDYSTLALKDPEWDSAVYGCWTPETMDAPLEKQESIWPSRWSSETLRKEKAAAIARNQLSLWLREQECKLTSPESAAFLPSWLRYYDLLPDRYTRILVIDPVPPPSDQQIAKGLRGKDYEAFAIVGAAAGNYFLVDYRQNRGHDPNWTIATFFELCLQYRPREVLILAVSYERTLAWILKQAMEKRRQYFVIRPIDDRRSKFDKIVDGLSGPASEGKFFVHREMHQDFVTQFTSYPDIAHDDLIEVVAVGVGELHSGDIKEVDYEELVEEEKEQGRLEYPSGYGCP